MSRAETAGVRSILRTKVHETSPELAVQQIISWASSRQSAYVTLTNVHMVMEAYDDPAFASIVNGASLSCPDGRPVYWALRSLGARKVRQVRGPALLPNLCAAAERTSIPVGFYGGTAETLHFLKAALMKRFPDLDIRCCISPPFRALTDAEDQGFVDEMNQSGAAILFVGLGCPKQEKWMAAHADRVHAVMLGVGAAFDINAGSARAAPALLSRLGLEWAFRLALEPRRLLRRYAKHNPRFVLKFGRQLVDEKLSANERQ